MAGLLDYGDTEDEKRQNLGLLALLAGGGILGANQPGASFGQAVGSGLGQGTAGLLQMQKAQQQQALQQQQMKLAQDRMVPQSVREYEYAKGQGFQGSFEDYRNKVLGRNEVPSNVREWEYFSSLSEPDQARYLTMKRSLNPINLGGTVAIPNPAVPAGPPMATYEKTPPPEQMPEFKGQQSLEAGRGTNQAARENTAENRGVNATNTLSMLDEADGLIDKSTGSLLGAGRDVVAGAVGFSTEGAKANAKLKVIQAGLMTNMPRMEGPQSDRDVQLYREAAGQIGDPTVPPDIKKAAVATIRTLQQKYKAAAPSSRNSGGASGGWSIQRVD